MTTPSHGGMASASSALVLTASRFWALATFAALAFTLVGSGAGLFLGEPGIRLGPGMGPTDMLRLALVLVLVAGLGHAAFRYASKHHGALDEVALLLFLTCGVNLVVQLTGGARSYWQGLYLVLGGLASVAFSRRLLVLMVATVLSLETANWLVQSGSSLVDLVRLSGLFLIAVVGYNYMERSERERAERAEDRLLRLDAGLRQLGSVDEPGDSPTDGAIATLSDDGHRAGLADQIHRLDEHVRPLLAIACRATESAGAVLLQVAANGASFWVRLGTEGVEASERRYPLKGSFLAESVRTERDLRLSRSSGASRLPWLSWDETVESIYAVPIRIWDEPPWILVLHHGEKDHFGEERCEVARSVAQQMREAQSLFRRQAQQHVDEIELKGLLRASEKMSGTTRLAELLEQLVDYARHVTAFDSCAVCLRAEEGDHFNVVVAEGYRRELLGSRFPLEAPTWAGWILRAREEPLAIRMERRTGMPILDPRERATPGASFLAVPLRAQKRVSGVVLLTRKDEAFTSRELRLLRIYCNQAAVALENAIVYEKVESLAATDALTGLYNRRYFESALSREMARADRAASRVALLVLDIDHFKSFNDTYGHAMGDLVLRKVAVVLGGALRKADVLARFGGEEFVVVLPQATERGALESAERLRESVASAGIHPGGPRKHVTVSIGVALFPDHAGTAEDLLKTADEALYDAKRSGRNRVCLSKKET